MINPPERDGGRATLFETLELSAQDEAHKSDLDPNFDSVAELDQLPEGAPYYTLPPGKDE